MPSLSLNTYQQVVGNVGRDTEVASLDVGARFNESLSPEIRDLLNFDAMLVMPGVDASLRQQLSSESFVTPENVVRFGQEIVAEFLASAFGDTLEQNNSAAEAATPVHSRIVEAQEILVQMQAQNVARLWETMLDESVVDSAAVVPAAKPSDFEQSMKQSLGLAA